VNPKIGLDFARAMRSFLRADPDVIMVGEMRDFETAKIGIEASLTGHLVLTTLHTNSAPELIPLKAAYFSTVKKSGPLQQEALSKKIFA